LFLILGVGALFFFNFHWVLVTVILLTYVVYLSYFYTKIEWLLDVTILLSAIVFGSVHYSAEELNFLQTLPFFLVQFSGGLILSWVIYTKNFLAGVISHAVMEFDYSFDFPLWVAICRYNCFESCLRAI